MNISELFYSIQGEGELTGVPSVFIRLSGCNLACTWCDTTYASRTTEGRSMTTDEIVASVNQYPAQHLVITGGEPLLSAELPDLTRKLAECSKHITIETNGTSLPDGIICDLASISPKLKNSGNDQSDTTTERINLEALRQWIDLYSYQLKFVVQTPDDLTEIKDLIQQLNRPIDTLSVLLMPESTTAPDTTWIIDACKENGYRYCHRLQYSLFGNQKGT